MMCCSFMCRARLVLRREAGRHFMSSERPKKKPIIACKRPQFDHFEGQSYSKFDGVPLASQGWLHNKSKNDYFTIYGNANKAEQGPEIETITKLFEDAGVSSNLVEVLHRLGFTAPTPIQSKAIKSILAGYNTMITAETGCGKTLAYLLPIMQNIIDWKRQITTEQFNSPLAVILSPSRELANQIGEVAEQLGRDMDVNISTLVGGRTKQKMLNPPVEHCHLLVASLGAFSKLVTTGIYRVHNARHVVLDEADTLLDDSFNDKLSHLLKKFSIQHKSEPWAATGGCQLTMVSATMPVELPDVICSFVDPQSLRTVTTQHMHHLMPHVPQKFIRLGKAQKPLELLKLVKADVAAKRPVMIFSNQTSTSDWVSMFLNENGVECINISGQMAVPLKLGKYEQYRSGKVDVLACTDIASRGLDTVNTQHVINYDFPLYTADYIHRCGRTGRLGGGGGRVTSMVAWPREVALVQRMELAVREGRELPSVNANIRRLIEERVTNFVRRDIRRMEQAMAKG